MSPPSLAVPTSIGVLSRSFSRHPVLRAELLAAYPTAVFNDSPHTLGGQALADFLAPHDAAIVALEHVDAALLGGLPNLRIISKYGVGLDNIDLHAAARIGIRIGWEGGVNRRSVAELARPSPFLCDPYPPCAFHASFSQSGGISCSPS